jgi:hypothetical protein
MPEYQVFTVGPDGEFIGSKVLICDDDAQAIEHARQLLDGHDLHIWSGPRYAGRLKHDDK